jgi:hypothetical protein
MQETPKSSTARTCTRKAWLGLLLVMSVATAAQAATIQCGAGDRVQGEFGGGEIGTIAEIGTQPPHVGAYRITFSWSPRGEWYHPDTWEVRPQGTSDRCQPPAGTAAATMTCLSARYASSPSPSAGRR